MTLHHVSIDRCIIELQVERWLLIVVVVIAGYGTENGGTAGEKTNSRYRRYQPYSLFRFHGVLMSSLILVRLVFMLLA